MERAVLVHGFTQTSASWGPVAERLARRFEVVPVDLPGHGGSGAGRGGVAEGAGVGGGAGGPGGRGWGGVRGGGRAGRGDRRTGRLRWLLARGAAVPPPGP